MNANFVVNLFKGISNMRNKSLVLILCLASSLIGCSSKPDVSDIEPELATIWGGCPLVKMSNLKKTNGLDHGNTYQMAYSYKLEVQEAATSLDDAGTHCSALGVNTIYSLTKLNKFDKGDIITITGEVNMVKSEKGWISQ